MSEEKFSHAQLLDLEYHSGYWETGCRAAMTFIVGAITIYISFFILRAARWITEPPPNTDWPIDVMDSLFLIMIFAFPIVTIYRFGFGAILLAHRNHIATIRSIKGETRENAQRFMNDYGPIFPRIDFIMLVLICGICALFNIIYAGYIENLSARTHTNQPLGFTEITQRSLVIAVFLFFILNIVDLIWDCIYLFRKTFWSQIQNSLALYGCIISSLVLRFVTGLCCVALAALTFKMALDYSTGVASGDLHNSISLDINIQTHTMIFVLPVLVLAAGVSTWLRVAVRRKAREKIRALHTLMKAARTTRRLSFAFIKIVTLVVLVSWCYLYDTSNFSHTIVIVQRSLTAVNLASPMPNEIYTSPEARTIFLMCALIGITGSIISLAANSEFFFPNRAAKLISDPAQ